MEIPKSFSLAGIDFTVKQVEMVDNGANYGKYIDVTNTIELASKIKVDGEWHNIPDHIKLNTYWHEVFHIFNYYWNTEFDECLAQVFANFMVEYEQSKE